MAALNSNVSIISFNVDEISNLSRSKAGLPGSGGGQVVSSMGLCEQEKSEYQGRERGRALGSKKEVTGQTKRSENQKGTAKKSCKQSAAPTLAHGVGR
jgi:hypothetical protein